MLRVAALVYAAAGGTLTSTRANYTTLLGVQVASLAFLAWMHATAFSGDQHNVVLMGVMGILTVSLITRAVFLASTSHDTNRAAKINRWDTLMTTAAYAATLGFAFRAAVPRGSVPLGRGWLGTTTVLVGVPSLSALGTAVVTSARDPDDTIMAQAVVLSRTAYTAPTIRDDLTDTRVVVVQEGEVLYVAFGGTDSARNIKTDLNAKDVHPAWTDSINPKLRVHAGFARAWDSVRDEVLAAVSAATTAVSIVTCGHSLGGALATVAALDLAVSTPKRIACYTFGSPQVGDQVFADAFKARVPTSVRVITPLDPIPKSLGIQFVHVYGVYVVSPLGAKLNAHDLDVYTKAVSRPRALGYLGIVLPIVYIILAVVLVSKGKRLLTHKTK
jgi:hypothetical protein